jgi:hypothetical protein
MKKLFVLSFFFSACTLFIEELTPPQPRHISPVGLASGDIDGDGDTDIVTVSFLDRSLHLSLLRQRGPGDFPAEIVSFATPAFAQLPIVASANTHLVDLDADADLDLITHSAITTASVFLNNGDGVFIAGAALSVFPRADILLVGDLDGDALPEVSIGSRGASGAVTVFQNEGGNFNTGVEVFEGPLTSLLQDDFDGDSLRDLLIVNESPRVTLLSNDGSGDLIDGDLFIGGFSGFTIPQEGFDPIAAGDIDGDQSPDIATIVSDPSSFVSRVVPLVNGGDGFATAPLVEVEGSLHRRLVLGDLDGDQDQDIVLGTIGSRLQILLNDGAANFALQTPIPVGEVIPMEVRDVDGDLDRDIICVTLDNQSQVNVVVLLNNNGTFASRLELASGDLFE